MFLVILTYSIDGQWCIGGFRDQGRRMLFWVGDIRDWSDEINSSVCGINFDRLIVLKIVMAQISKNTFKKNRCDLFKTKIYMIIIMWLFIVLLYILLWCGSYFMIRYNWVVLYSISYWTCVVNPILCVLLIHFMCSAYSCSCVSLTISLVFLIIVCGSWIVIWIVAVEVVRVVT